MFAIFLSLVIDHTIETTKIQRVEYWRYSSVILNTVFLSDLVLNLFFIGIIQVTKKKKYLILEIVLQLSTILVYLYIFDNNAFKASFLSRGISIAMTIYLLRLVRMLDFITEI